MKFKICERDAEYGIGTLFMRDAMEKNNRNTLYFLT